MAINAVIRFLQAARSMAQRGMKKEQILDFARREFGKVYELLKKQIDDIFKTKPKTEKKGEVVPIKKNPLEEVIDKKFGKDTYKKSLVRRPEEFDTRKEYEKYLDETLGPPDDVFGSPLKDDLLKEWDKVKIKNVTPKEGIMATDEAADMVKGEVNPITDQMSTQQRQFLGFPNKNVEAIVRTAARDVLEKAGLGPRIKDQDPIDMARQIYGEDFLEALDNISGELLEASSYPEIARILTDKKIYNFKPRQGLDVRQKGEIEDITAFDPEGRDPNADGGLIDILKL